MKIRKLKISPKRAQRAVAVVVGERSLFTEANSREFVENKEVRMLA